MPTKSVVEIIQNEIKLLFIEQDESTAIQLEVLECYKENKDEYNERIKKSINDVGKNNFTDFLNSISINDEVGANFKISTEDDVPLYFKSPISGKPLNKNNGILASSGIWYDKDDLRQLIASNPQPRCVVTNKLLTETLNDFQPR